VPPASCGDVQPMSVCLMPKRRAESAGVGAGMCADAKRRAVSTGVGFLLTGAGAGGGGGVLGGGRSRGDGGRPRRALLGGVRGAGAGCCGWSA